MATYSEICMGRKGGAQPTEPRMGQGGSLAGFGSHGTGRRIWGRRRGLQVRRGAHGVARAGVRLRPAFPSEIPHSSGGRRGWGYRDEAELGVAGPGGKDLLRVCKILISFQPLPPSTECVGKGRAKGLVATWCVTLKRGGGGQGRGMPGQEQCQGSPERQQGGPVEGNGADGRQAAGGQEVCRQVETVRWVRRSAPRKMERKGKGDGQMESRKEEMELVILQEWVSEQKVGKHPQKPCKAVLREASLTGSECGQHCSPALVPQGKSPPWGAVWQTWVVVSSGACMSG